MSHHGWVPVIEASSITPAGLKSPFGRLFPATNHKYNSHAISLLSGALSPMQKGAVSVATKPGNPAGFTFLGQFIDHDMTEFRVLNEKFGIILQNPTIDQRQLVLEDNRIKGEFPTTTNGRSGKLDLDSVYGILGVAQLDLFDENGMFKLRSDNKDILRIPSAPDGRLIADFRNDENKIIVQLHILFERLHNKIHGGKPGTPSQKGPGGPVFNETKAQVQKIYRSIVVNDYLPRIVTIEQLEKVARAIKDGKSCYQKMIRRNRAALAKLGIPENEISDAIAVPVEFSHAAFRLGHSQLLGGYLMNPGNPFPLFELGTGKPDLRGRSTIENHFIIDWSFFFKITEEAGKPVHGSAIDGELSESIFRLPAPAIDAPPLSLAERNIRRGIDFGLPSGQEAASIFTETYGYIETTPPEKLFSNYGDPEPYVEILKTESSFAWKTPLWYYILKEAENFGTGPELGPVGGYIVAETLLGSLAETDGLGIDLLIAQISTMVNPEDLTFDIPADIDNIKTMGQMISYINS